MQIIYKSDDGIEFATEEECEEYEYFLRNPILNAIKFYTISNDEFVLLSDVRLSALQEYYEAIEKIEVPTEEAVKALKDFSKWTGFCAYEDCSKPGTWIWNGNEFIFN